MAAGVYADVAAAQAVMASAVCQTYLPDPAQAALYDGLYQNYRQLGDYVNSSRQAASAGGVL